MGGLAEEYSPMLASSASTDDVMDELLVRTGTTWTAVAHIITGVIGAGVLSLAWSIAQLGWIAGPSFTIVFAAVTLYSSRLLCDCYRYPDPEFGPSRIRSFQEAVKLYLGKRSHQICRLITLESMYGCAAAFTITAASSIRAILRSNCYHKEGHEAPCNYDDNTAVLYFGIVQILMSQIPDFQNMEWLSVFSTIMAFTFCFVGFGLGVAKVIENGSIKGSITGVQAGNGANKLWTVFEALGDIAYAFPYTLILFEIQDTLKSPPPENKTMKKASTIAIFIITFFYISCGCFGYAAFGNDTPGNLLTGFGFYEPYWLIDLANVCIVLYLVGAYQIYSQPVFAFVEAWLTRKFPDSGFVKNFSIKLPLIPALQVNLLRIFFRILYVVSTTIISIVFPYFNQILGVLGAVNFWPLALYFPVEMYFVQQKIRAWTKKWILLRTLSFACLLVAIGSFIGSVAEIIIAKLG